MKSGRKDIQKKINKRISSNILKIISEELEMKDKNYDFSKKEMAKKLEISESGVSELFSGDRNWTIEYVEKTAEFLNTTVLDVLYHIKPDQQMLYKETGLDRSSIHTLSMLKEDEGKIRMLNAILSKPKIVNLLLDSIYDCIVASRGNISIWTQQYNFKQEKDNTVLMRIADEKLKTLFSFLEEYYNEIYSDILLKKHFGKRFSEKAGDYRFDERMKKAEEELNEIKMIKEKILRDSEEDIENEIKEIKGIH